MKLYAISMKINAILFAAFFLLIGISGLQAQNSGQLAPLSKAKLSKEDLRGIKETKAFMTKKNAQYMTKNGRAQKNVGRTEKVRADMDGRKSITEAAIISNKINQTEVAPEQ